MDLLKQYQNFNMTAQKFVHAWQIVQLKEF